MELLVELLKYSIPAALVLVGMLLVMRENQKKAETRERYQLMQKSLADIIPLRLQAYERAILFLERISPEHLLLRVDGRGKTARIFHAQLLVEIRAEYEHNIAQQLYVSPESWMGLVQAKEQVTSLINQSVQEVSPEAGGVELGKRILQKMMDSQSPSFPAIMALKGDVQGMFRV